jgi:hypothetical protein
VGPNTTGFHVEGFRSLQVFSEYVGIDTTTGSCPAAMSAQSPDLWSPVAIRRRARRVLPLCRQGTPLVAERAVRHDERAGTELGTAAAGAERAASTVSYPIASRSLVTAHRTGQRGEVPEGDVAEHLDHVRRTQMPVERLAAGQQRHRALVAARRAARCS